MLYFLYPAVRVKLDLEYELKVKFSVNENDEVAQKPARAILNDLYGA
jgi:hypothetical protein